MEETKERPVTMDEENKKEWNLSDKVKRSKIGGVENERWQRRTIAISDVKEFVRKLKDIMGVGTLWRSAGIKEMIDKLAGESLSSTK